MPDPSWPACPPEVNYLRLAGTGAAGTATTLASAVAWQALVAANESALSLSAVNTAATAADFEGVGGTSSSATATDLNTSLQLLTGWTQQKPPIVSSAISAYETALAAMIPAPVSLANRAEQAADVAMNPLVLGALTPAIVALDATYFGEHWPQNAGAGAAYGAALTALAAVLTVPPPLTPSGSSTPVAAAAAIAQEGAQVAAGQAMKQTAAATAKDATAPVGMAGQAAAMLTQPLQSASGMFTAPLQSLQGLAGLAPSTAGPSEEMLDTSEYDMGMPMVGATATPNLAAPGATGVGMPSAGSATSLATGGLTAYTRPATSFPAENAGGRPVGLKTGALSTAELHGPTAVGPMMPVRPSKESTKEDEVPKARVAVTRRPR